MLKSPAFSTSFLESRMIQKLKSRKSRIKPGLFAFLLAERIIFGKKTQRQAAASKSRSSLLWWSRFLLPAFLRGSCFARLRGSLDAFRVLGSAFSFALSLAFTAGIPFVTPTPAASCRSRAAWGDFLSSQRAANKSHRTATRWLLFGRYSRSFRAGQAGFLRDPRPGGCTPGMPVRGRTGQAAFSPSARAGSR